jgi:hypothetical protein
MFEEYSSDSDDEEYNPYTYEKCPYGYYKGCCTCCKRCLLERREKEWDEYSKDFTERLFREYFKEQFDFVFTQESKMNKFKEYEFMEINYNKFMKLNKKEKLRKLKKQYRKLSLKYHPDKKTGSNESFNTLKSSYDLLFSVWFHS